MNLSRLVFKEIAYRKGNFFLGIFVVTLAVLCVAGSMAVLRSFEKQTQAILDKMEEDTRAEMAKLEDSIRKTMKGLGFNIYIFPKDQDMTEVYDKGYASKTMPEEYVNRLANSKIVTVNHLLPSLTRKMQWPEKQRTVILIGVRGEVPLMHKAMKSPLIDPVARGDLVVGYELHNSMGLKVGDEVKFMGRSFKISKTHSARGSTDDITMWMNLEECQEMLDLEGRINAIQALECNCSSVDRLGEIREELYAILPDTHIIETHGSALARAEARNQAKATAEKAMADKKKERAVLQAEHEGLASILIPMVTLGAMGVIALLTFFNVRGRITEIGILRAIGVQSGRLLGAFMIRALLVGLIGVGLGLGLGIGLAIGLKDALFHGFDFAALLTDKEFNLIRFANEAMKL
ncbi:MAG: FtsX-like permease family protein, partial [Verrucomicrobiota bacterium]